MLKSKTSLIFGLKINEKPFNKNYIKPVNSTDKQGNRNPKESSTWSFMGYKKDLTGEFSVSIKNHKWGS